ncbi:hypothetical protein, partial [Klebsiella michiganensis]
MASVALTFFALPPGNSAMLRSAPGGGANAPCPGYRFTAVCGLGRYCERLQPFLVADTFSG